MGLEEREEEEKPRGNQERHEAASGGAERWNSLATAQIGAASRPSMASSSSLYLSRPSPSLPPRSPLFTPIPEQEKEEEEEEEEESAAEKPKPTPLHPSSCSSTATTTTTSSIAASQKKKKQKPPTSKSSYGSSNNDDGDDGGRSVSCTNCRPSSRDKIFDINVIKHSPLSPNPNAILRSIFFTLTRRSPARNTSSSSTTSSASAAAAAAAATAREEEWKRAAAELSRKLLHATRKRDEALLEATRLKFSVSELERKLGRLESYCHDLKSALDRCAAGGPSAQALSSSAASLPIDPFRQAITDSRSAVRHLGRSLSAHLRQGAAAGGGSRSLDRIASLLLPQQEARAAAGQWRRSPGSALPYMEALLNRIFYGEFETQRAEGEDEVDPAMRCGASRAAYEAVRRLGWEEVLSRGTRHYSEGLSRFCDKKMSEVVGAIGWARAWPEGLLQSFFGAAKGAWAVHLLARSVHPAVPILRVGAGARFDPGFMEEVAGERGRRLAVVGVRMMVAPGFYVYTAGGGVVKCKVLCKYGTGTGDGQTGQSVGNVSQ